MRHKDCCEILAWLFLLLNLGIRCKLADAEDDELRWLAALPDQADHPAVVDIVLGHGGTIATHEVGLFRFIAEQGAVAPQYQQEVLDCCRMLAHSFGIVGFENSELGALVD